ncbi:M81 family metallopeptidase [Roseomonas marmotae]|uniref:Microcystinase C n=1 Tax=Roseomonas marmotae TaxID=2768161 RepID=A0ABS3KE31_9PROT|nr:M81 family metallopeptidase [Roseomonas marmotae]MBO1074601.1 M81 family metallopeptidase [Roseomonas marmotae]QTI81628.1 M81 family metallopeptidase [Roseomonas marmotae]
MKIFMATLATETNTFSPIPTGWAGFKEGRVWYRDDGSRHPPTVGNIPLITWRRRGEADGHELVESLCTFAQPAGTTLRHVYEGLRDMMLEDLRRAGPVDAVLLFMHGAMVAHGYDDCEGDTLAHIREIVGPKAKIGIELDLHCHLTELMRTSADVIITFKEYPHTDIAERAEELYTLCTRAAAGEISPVMAYHDCRMVSMWRTPEQPMRDFVARMAALEGKDGILSVSFGHGFPWGDVEEVGAKMLVVADGDMAKAQALATRLGEEVWAMREATATRHDTIDEGIDHALSGSGGPMVLADVADNAGGGAPSDNTAILRRLVDRGVRGAVIGCFWDPIAVQFCMEAGEGASFLLRVGGKCGPASGDPVDLMVTVRKLDADFSQTGLSGGRANFGPSAWISADGIDIVLVTKRQQTFAPDAFTGLGITLEDKAVVVVKSTQHFHAAFAPVAREIRYVSAPGAIPPEFAEIPFTKRTRPYWPRVADPFALTNQA